MHAVTHANTSPTHLNEQLALVAECIQVFNGAHVLQDEHVSALGQLIKGRHRPGVTCRQKQPDIGFTFSLV